MKVKTGLETILSHPETLRGKRVGLIAHPASVDGELRHAIDLCAHAADIDLRALFGPQHGARGETQDNMIEWSGYEDPRTGLPVYSLYGETREPTAEMLEGLDLLLVDLQDVGARYYTFIYTMALAMKAAARHDLEIVVLDRPNPLGGLRMEGPILDPEFRSFVGLYSIPPLHGMTVGELALYFNQEENLGCDLTVVPMKGWKREMHFPETGLPWVFPSPNIPRFETTLVYPGMCLLEGTNLSEGRGTTLPFEISGAPWIDPHELRQLLEDARLPGVRFRALHFQPTFHKWTGHLVGGVQLYVDDWNDYQPFLTALTLIFHYRALGGSQFQWKQPPYEYEYEKLPFDILAGTDEIRRRLESGSIPEPASWQDGLDRFVERRQEYLLY